MDTPAFDATRFLRSVSLSIALYLSIIMIAMMTIIKPAHASGTVAKPSGTNYIYVGSGSTGGDGTQPTIAQVVAETLVCNGLYTDVNAMSPCLIAATGYAYQSGWYWAGWWALHLSSTSPNSIALGAVFGGVAACPANSADTTTTTCTCNAGYVPDPTGTSCVPPVCPAHSSGTPCVCDAGYEFDATGTRCDLVQYTLTLKTDPPEKIEPSGTATVIALVEKTVGGQKSPKSGATVSIKVDVDAGTGGHDHDTGRHVSPHTGTLDAATGTTGPDGKVSFTFGAPEVSGTHTFTVACISPACTNNPQTIKIDVKVVGLKPIPGSPFYSLQDSAGNVIGAVGGKHSDNHYLTGAAIKKLKEFAQAYQDTVNPGAKLYLNDASLVWGGLFDVGSTPWKPPHAGHRRGVGLDIRAENSGPNKEGAVPTTSFADVSIEAAKAHAKAELHCAEGQIGAVCNGIPDNRHFHVDF